MRSGGGWAHCAGKIRIPKSESPIEEPLRRYQIRMTKTPTSPGTNDPMKCSAQRSVSVGLVFRFTINLRGGLLHLGRFSPCGPMNSFTLYQLDEVGAIDIELHVTRVQAGDSLNFHPVLQRQEFEIVGAEMHSKACQRSRFELRSATTWACRGFNWHDRQRSMMDRFCDFRIPHVRFIPDLFAANRAGA